jgi:hypothetical protein
MLHAGDYVFLIAISFSVYLVGLRLLQMLHGNADERDQTSQAEGNGNPAGARR